MTMSALRLTWIMQAMSMGARIEIVPVSFNPMEYQANCRWPRMANVVGGSPERAITDALNGLNDALQDDCAREMMERGQA